MVARVAVVHDQKHKYEVEVTYPEWTDEGQQPFPFLLGGHAAAIVVMDLKERIGPAARVLVSYDGKRENCTKFGTSESVLLNNRTALPPDSLAIMKPPG